jgi:hypothetical protein
MTKPVQDNNKALSTKESVIDKLCTFYRLDKDKPKDRETIQNAMNFHASFREEMNERFAQAMALDRMDLKDGAASNVAGAVGVGANFIPVVGQIAGLAVDLMKKGIKELERLPAEEEAKILLTMSGPNKADRLQEWSDFSKDVGALCTAAILKDKLAKLDKKSAQDLGKKTAEAIIATMVQDRVTSILPENTMFKLAVKATGLDKSRETPATSVAKANAMEFGLKHIPSTTVANATADQLAKNQERARI